MVDCNDTKISTGIIPNDQSPVLFWDKDLRLAKALEYNGHRLFNSSSTIEICDDKTLTALALGGIGIKIPETIIAPMTYSGIGYIKKDFINEIVSKLGFPVIVKEAFGSFGAQVYKCDDLQSLRKIINDHQYSKLLFQKYISSSYGRDVRLQVVGNDVVSAMYRYSVNDDFRANITNGGQMRPYVPNNNQKDLAIEVTRRLGLDFAGIDLMFSTNDEPILCEVNSNAHFINIDNCTGSNVALSIINHIKKTCI